MSTSVPKFSSFRPPLKDTSQSREEHERDKHSRKRSDPRDHSHERRLRREEQHERKHHRSLNSGVTAAGHPQPLVLQNPTATADWKLDTKGDIGILQFGFTEASKISRYHLFTRQRIGGTRGQPRLSDERSLTSLSRHDVKKLFAKERTFRFDSPRVSQFGTDPTWHVADFVPLSVLGKRKRVSRTNAHSDTEGTSSSSADTDIVSDDDSVANQPTTTEVDTKESDLRAQQQELQRRVKASPHDARSWLDFANFQEVWVYKSLDSSSPDSNRRTAHENEQTTSHLKLAILEEGKRKLTDGNGNGADHEDILLAIVAESEKLLHPSEMRSKWARLVNEHPSAHRLWTRYLQYIQCKDGSRINVEPCGSEYSLYLKYMSQSSLPDSTLSHPCRVFSHYTSFLYQCGYTERAVAFWQLLLHVRFFAQPSPKADPAGGDGTDKLVSAPEEFWESERSRPGEHTTSTWAKNLPTAKPVNESDGTAHRNAECVGRDSIGAWSNREISDSRSLCLPGRTTDDDESDPFHVVLFSDLEHCLDFITLPFTARTVVAQFLAFCNLPPLPKVDAATSIAPSQLTISKDFSKPTSSQRIDGGKEHFTNMKPTVRTMFEHKSSPFKQFQTVGHLSPPLSEFARNALEQLILIMPDDVELAEYCIALGAVTDPKRARKFTKHLLTNRSSDLRLYNSLALLEAGQEKSEDSDRICTTAITLGKKIAGQRAMSDRILLKHTWVWNALRQEHEKAALERLFSSDDDEDVADINARLRQSRVKIDMTAKHGTSDHTAAAVDCFALLHYLSPFAGQRPDSGARPDLEQAYRAYEDVLSGGWILLPPHTCEIVQQSLVQLIYHHVATYGRALALPFYHDLLAYLGELTIRYPHNTCFMEVHNLIIPKTDRIRALLPSSGGKMSSPSNLGQWSLAIATELRRGIELGGSQIAVRKQFEDAVASEEGQHCPALWAWWVRFEVSLVDGDSGALKETDRGSKRRLDKHRQAMKKARDVWLRGWHNLPWVKDWLLLGVRLLGDALTEDETKGFYNTMVDRGLRFHNDLVEWTADKGGCQV